MLCDNCFFLMNKICISDIFLQLYEKPCACLTAFLSQYFQKVAASIQEISHYVLKSFRWKNSIHGEKHFFKSLFTNISDIRTLHFR